MVIPLSQECTYFRVYKGNHVVFVLCLISFIQHSLLQVHPYCHKWFPSFSWLIFYFIHMPHFLYPFMQGLTLRLLPYLGYCEQCCSEMGVQNSLRSYFNCFDICPGIIWQFYFILFLFFLFVFFVIVLLRFHHNFFINGCIHLNFLQLCTNSLSPYHLQYVLFFKIKVILTGVE